jgi:hypothetical protein
MQRRSVVFLCCLAVLALLSISRAADAFCTHLTDWWPTTQYSSIPVVIHQDVPANLRHKDGAPWTQGEFAAEIRHLLEKINASTGAPVPPLYLATPAFTSSVAPEIHKIKLILKPAGACGFAASCGGGPAVGGCLIEIPRYNCTQPDKVFEPFLTTYPVDDNSSVLMHEFAHVIGLRHPDECPPAPSCQTIVCDVAGATADVQEFNAFFIDDSNGLRQLYGGSYIAAREHYERFSSSWNLLSSSSVPAHLPGAGASDSATDNSYMAFARRAISGQTVSFYRWVFSNLSWGYWGFLTRPGNGPVGAAYNQQGGKGYFAFQTAESNTYTDKSIEWTGLTGYSSNPTAYVGAGTVTRRHGVDVAFEPRTGLLVAVTRATYVPNETQHWQILVHLINPSTNQVLRSFAMSDGGQPLMAGDTPSIACGATSISFNCMLVWEEAAQPGNQLATRYHVMRSVQFAPSNTFGFWTLTFGSQPISVGPSTSSGYIAYGRPSVTYKGPAGAPDAYLVSWSSPYSTTSSGPGSFNHTMYKSGSPTAAWTGLQTLPSSSTIYRTAATLGAAGGAAEAIRMKKP